MSFTFDSKQIFIGGVWRDSVSGRFVELMNPSTGETLAQVARGSAADIHAAVVAAQAALDSEWGAMTAVERGRVLARMGEIVLTHIDELAEMEAKDVGKPLTQARNDVIAMARYFEFYAGACDKIHGDSIPFMDGFTVYTLREPHGVTGHIIPWNYPMQIIGRSVGAALAMGNAAVLKPAEEACLTALALGDIAVEAGLPAGALNIVPGIGTEAGAALTAHEGVHHISFTGSNAVGTMVQQSGGEHVIPVTLELGGKSPQIVFDDADLDAAMPFLVNGGIQNAGQTCSAASRILVQRGIYDDVVAGMVARYEKLRVGNAMDDLDLGPMISKRQQQIVDGYLKIAEADGLEMLAQGDYAGDLPKGGSYILPTLFGNVSPEHRLAQEEIFGPVQVIIPFEDEADAVRIANGTDFGLVAGVWTENGGRQLRMAKKLHVGQVFINNYGAGGGVELPFGGVKGSGHGREKGFEALYGFSVTKTVAIKHG
ncbi:MAG: aldehyde dehydrogenase family protein [OCS116 cluster bacterium]|nr:aldehyde dehydrogenase family protein [OCS116 cluster bacterium]